MEIYEDEMAPTKRIFVFGLEAIIAMVLGIFFLFCNTVILWKTQVIGRLIDWLVDIFPPLRLLGFGKKIEIPTAPRINADNCCICLDDIQKEVSSTCGHIFCGNFVSRKFTNI